MQLYSPRTYTYRGQSVLISDKRGGLYIYIFQDEKCRLMRNLSFSMDF